MTNINPNQNPVTDHDRDAALAAEASMRAAAEAGVLATFQGQDFTPEPDPTFMTPAAVAEHVRGIFDLLAGAPAFTSRDLATPTVRSRPGSALVPSYDTATTTIVLPSTETPGAWPVRGSHLYAAVAHHLAETPDHTVTYRAEHLLLLEALHCPERSRLLSHAYDHHGLGAIGAETPEHLLTHMSQAFAVAERGGTEAERDLALSRVHILISRHRIAEAVLTARTPTRAPREAPTFSTHATGPRRYQGFDQDTDLMIAIITAHPCNLLIYPRQRMLRLFGYTADRAVCWTLFTSLRTQRDTAFTQHLTTHPKTYEPSRYPGQPPRPIHTKTRRLDFNEVYAAQIRQRLQTLTETTPTSTDPSTALELTNRNEHRQEAYQDYLQTHNIATYTTRYRPGTIPTTDYNAAIDSANHATLTTN